ncbi:MAG: SPOR domain-containing protein [Bacteroidales bacterium]
MKKILLTSLFTIFYFFSFSQMYVQYDIEPEVEKIKNAHILAWKKVGYVEGYRIQLIALSGSKSKNSVQEVYNEFTKLFPEIPAYLSYSEPNFRVRVGNFNNKIDAYRNLLKIHSYFPGAFITKDKISYREI